MISEQRSLIVEAVQLFYPFNPRKEQVDCIHQLVYEKNDLVLVAKTSFGKSLIPSILPSTVPQSIIIVILPLLALGEEQTASIQSHLSLGGLANPIFVNSTNICKQQLREIKPGIYTHIFISPEILTGKDSAMSLHHLPFGIWFDGSQLMRFASFIFGGNNSGKLIPV
ncbi:hypothetical protein BGW36DRAFT_205304 [Talaromyces proteolyticus]|uniref:DEAD/DEAH box helicase domain-containing protein n=1 Tax=Talaromyces proteolyticus TaxID=1131652 RepID=A0AAD4KS07_9EURO|nr:uncharacterized protein BGW36DRAFT_205304 [Talaromyces proteolyticus]KAH8695646.1 hypothetical protein BGW36DRAFT_205304 [Talaromyces proteolyticus]